MNWENGSISLGEIPYWEIGSIKVHVDLTSFGFEKKEETMMPMTTTNDSNSYHSSGFYITISQSETS